MLFTSLVVRLIFFFNHFSYIEIPEHQKYLVTELNEKLLEATLDKEFNPSVYIGLRLSEEHNVEKENEYLQRLMPEELCSR